jgi:hypothetical protein
MPMRLYSAVVLNDKIREHVSRPAISQNREARHYLEAPGIEPG